MSFHPGEGITGTHLTVDGKVPRIGNDMFAEAAEKAKAECPVSAALTGTTITLTAKIV